MKYKVYDTFPLDTVGKIIEHKETKNRFMVIACDKQSIGIHNMLLSTETAFNFYQFADGTPIGELVETELEHDKVYLVRTGDDTCWVPRHYAERNKDYYYFYDNGFSSKTCDESYRTTSYTQVCKYDEELKHTNSKPKEYLVKQN